MGTKNNPGKYDCLAKAEPDEPFFVLLARDPRAPGLVRDWAMENVVEGLQPREKIEEALKCADAMEQWRKDRRP